MVVAQAAAERDAASEAGDLARTEQSWPGLTTELVTLALPRVP